MDRSRRSWVPLGVAPVTLALVTLVLGGCRAGVGSSPDAPGSAGSPGPGTPPPTASPAEPSTPAVTQPPHTASPAASAAATPHATLEPPPAAVLVGGGGTSAGTLGSFSWRGGFSDSPWLPASALETLAVSPGDELRVEVADGPAIETWTVRADDATDTSGIEPTGVASGTGPPAFALPRSADLVVSVDLVFAGGAGDATWYWHVVVR